MFSSFSSICLFSRGSVTLSWKISTNSDKLCACTSCLDFCSKHPLTVAKKSMRALFLEWIDSCEAYSELFGLAGGLQAGKMMLRRGCLARVTHDSTKAVDGDDVSLFWIFLQWRHIIMDSFAPKLDWFRHRFLINDNSYLFSWSRRLKPELFFSVTAAAFSRSCPGSRVLFSVSAHWIRWIVCLWGKLQIYQRLLKADVPAFAWVPLGF